MPKKTARPHVCLICWDPPRAQERADALRLAGYRVTLVTASVSSWIGYVRDLALDAVVLDLDRLPSHGRQVGVHLRASKSVRHLPLVYLGGEPAKVERVRADLPDAMYAQWEQARRAIDGAIAGTGVAAVGVPGARVGRTVPVPRTADLVGKLGIKPELPTMLWGDADFLHELLGDADLTVTRRPAQEPGLWLAVTRRAADVEAFFHAAAKAFAAGSSVWIIHPKQASRYATDFNQNDVRAIGLAHGWVDYKVCAVDADWSGLKFARRKAEKPLALRSRKRAAKSGEAG